MSVSSCQLRRHQAPEVIANPSDRRSWTAWRHRSRQDSERCPQRAFRYDRKDVRVLPGLIDRRPVVVGRHERALIDRLELVAIYVPDVELALDRPRDLAI